MMQMDFIDGNDTGKKLEKYIFSGDLRKTTEFSKKLLDTIACFKNIIEHMDGKVYVAGGDNIIATIPRKYLKELHDGIRKYETDEMKFAIGIGNTMLDAYLALKYVKAAKSETVMEHSEGVFFQVFGKK